MSTYYPFSRPLYVMAKPAGAHCNLACQYCYYLEKQHLYSRGENHVMSDSLLEHYIQQYIETQMAQDVLFTWHGGEPMMRPLSFYRRVLELQQRYAGEHRIANCIQTNGTLLTPEWCRFLAENHWLVGVSIDGPQEYHDAYRRTRRGLPSHAQVMKGIRMMQQYGVEWNAMAVVNAMNADHPLEFYDFFRELDCRYIQFTPVVERLIEHSDGRHLAHVADQDCPVAPFSVRPEQWGHFLCTLFDEWVQHDVGEYFIQTFDATLAGWMGVAPGVCSLAPECGHAAVMEYNGDVYSCDHFVFPEYRLGNVMSETLPQMLYGERQQAFGRMKQSTLPRQCRQCRWLRVCNGECPRNRFLHTAAGEPYLNYLCAGYQRYFAHVAPYMEYMKAELMAGRPASGVMNYRP